jgi:cytochrome c-type protein NapC
MLVFAAGVVVWGALNWAMELSNTESFCVSCHEMRENAFKEYQESVHYSNRTGVRATCPDCHVPRAWHHKFWRKIASTGELYHKLLGSVDTPEKFNAKRLELARLEWARMKASDSRECRNCHDFDSFDYSEQERRAARQHQAAYTKGQTCIDCHKGIAHALPLVEQEVGAKKGGAIAQEFHPRGE